MKENQVTELFDELSEEELENVDVADKLVLYIALKECADQMMNYLVTQEKNEEYWLDLIHHAFISLDPNRTVYHH